MSEWPQWWCGGVPCWGQEVEDAVEDVVQVGVALLHEQHQGIAARRAHHHTLTAALLPQRRQNRPLPWQTQPPKNTHFKHPNKLTAALMVAALIH